MQPKRLWWLGGVVALLAGQVSGAPREGTLLVANRDGGSVSLIDLPTGFEMARLPIGPVIPHEVSVSPDGRLALTSEYGPDDNMGHRVVVIDVANAEILGRIDLPEGARPHSTRFLPDGRRALATMEERDELALLDVVERRVIRIYPTGGREGHMVRVSPDGRRAYVTSRGAEGTLSVIFLEEERDPVVIPTGSGAEGLAVTPDGSEIWVVNRTAGSISVVDAERLAVVATVPARQGAGRAEITAAGRVVVPNGGGGSQGDPYLTIYHTASREMRDEISLREGVPPAPGAFGILIREESVIVTDRGHRRILMYDLEHKGPPVLIASNHEDPDGMAWSPVRVAVLSQ